MKYKILFFSELLGSGGGGIASQRIINSFKDHECVTISLSNEKDTLIKVKFYFIKFFFRFLRILITTSFKFNFNSFIPSFGIYSFKNLEKKIGKFEPDLIIVTWVEYIVSLNTIYQLKEKYNSKIIFVAMDNYLFTGGCRYTNECDNYKNDCENCLALKNNFKHIAKNNLKFYKNYFHKIDPMFMLPSDHSKKFYKSLNLNYKFKEFDFWPIQFEKLISKNNNLVDRFKASELEKILNKKKIVICPIQNFQEPRKGWKYLYYSLIDFQNQLSEKNINLHFIFIGNIEKQHINSFKNLRVSYDYFNYLSSERLEEYYLISDFGIVPSIQEWAAISTNEMMSFGLPVINFRTGSSKNIIVNGKNGFVVNLQNIYDLSSKL